MVVTLDEISVFTCRERTPSLMRPALPNSNFTSTEFSHYGCIDNVGLMARNATKHPLKCHCYKILLLNPCPRKNQQAVRLNLILGPPPLSMRLVATRREMSPCG